MDIMIDYQCDDWVLLLRHALLLHLKLRVQSDWNELKPINSHKLYQMYPFSEDSTKNQYVTNCNDYLKIYYLLMNTQVQNYRLIKQIGSGSYSVVYKAEDVNTHEFVAIKKMKQLARNDEEVVQNEIDLLKEIDKENSDNESIIKYITDFKENQIWYIVFEYCGKGDMEGFKKKQGKLPEAFCKNMIHRIIKALCILHDKKVVHRDLKLANILINDSNDFKLADFGFSKKFESEWMRSFCGTPYAMAPEIFKLEEYDERCDTWSLGIMCYQLLYGVLPFVPGKKYGFGMSGLSNCVLNARPFYDPSVSITDECQNFMELCLCKEKQKRPKAKQLLNHKWFHNVMESNIRRQMMDSMSGQNQSLQKAQQVLNGAVHEHIKRLVQNYNLVDSRIKVYLTSFDKHYPQKEYIQIKAMICLMIRKIVNELEESKIYINVEEREFEIQLNEINAFQEHVKNLKGYLITEIQKIQKEDQSGTQKKVNIERSLIRFLAYQAASCISAMENVPEKTSLISYISMLPLNQPIKSNILIEWSCQKQQPNSHIKFKKCVDTLPIEQVKKCINQPSCEQNIHKNWLIEHQFKVQSRPGKENWVGEFIMNTIKINAQKPLDNSGIH